MKDFLKPPVPAPAAVNVIGAIMCVFGLLSLFRGVRMLIEYFGPAAAKLPTDGRVPHSLLLATVLVILVVASAICVAGVAFLNLRHWGYYLTRILFWFFALGSGLGLITLVPYGHHSPSKVALEVLGLAIWVAGILSLRRPAVREAFTAAEAARKAANSSATVEP